MEARGGLSRAGGECRGNSSRYFSSLSVNGGDNTSYLPGKQGGLKGNEVGKQHRVLGASGPEPADDAFFLLSSLGRSKPIHKMPSQPLPLQGLQPLPRLALSHQLINAAKSPLSKSTDTVK